MSPDRAAAERTAPVADTRDFLLADLGEGLEEATIVSWLVQVGDLVELNQPICVVETAKAEVEVPSAFAGRVVALGGDEGATIPVGGLLARIAPAAADARDPSPASGVVDPPATPEPGTTRQPTLVGYGHDPSIDRSRRSGRGTVASGRHRRTAPRKPITKPPVRLLARRLGIDLDDLVPGSGPGGVVTRADVEAAAAARENGNGERSTAADAERQVPSAAPTVVPVTGVRARIAEHLARSRAEIPDATASVVADCTRLLEVRELLVAHAERRRLDTHVTPFALLCRLVVLSLRDVPVLNSSFDEAGPEIRLHNGVHLGIGTATDRGLVVTVVHDAHDLAVHDLATELARLVEGARAGSLTPAELTGSTFTISNYGALGLDDGVPIVNHPEAAILGVGAIRPRPHVVDGEVVARPTVHLTLAFDHRVCDGADAARFLTGLRELVETPELALLGS